jgi:hypothetical protein
MTDPNASWAQPEGGAGQGPVAPVTPAPLVKPKGKGSSLTNALLVVAALVAVGGVTFALGRATAPAAAAGDAGGVGRRGADNQGNGGARSPGTGNRNTGGAAGVRMINGTVKDANGSTLTLTTGDGTAVVIDVSGADYHSQGPATAGDVTEGSTVSITVTGSGRARQSTNGTAQRSPGTDPAVVSASEVTIIATP